MLNIGYRASDRKAILSWATADEHTGWIDVIRRLVFDNAHDAEQESGFRLSLPWWSFAALRPQLMDVFRGYHLRLEEEIQIEPKARELLLRSARATQSYESARNAPVVEEEDLSARLRHVGFMRSLTAGQIRNITRLAALAAGATFSVPGAGKTTEALAIFSYRAKHDDRLLVVSPKNAFASWDEQLLLCMPHIVHGFVRLRGGHDRIAVLLEANPRFLIITYQQLTRVRNLIAGHLAEHSVFVFLDESHRIKSGATTQTAQTALSLAHLPSGKLILSGTPMPQSTDDLVPQFQFLYPEIHAVSDRVIELMRPIYVRTTKQELGLPPVIRRTVSLPMAPVQQELYRLMKQEVAREIARGLNVRTKQAFRSIGRSVQRLLQFTSNPSLLAGEIGLAHTELMRCVFAEGDGPKLSYVFRRTRELALEGRKVLIWTSFVKNVEYMAERLADLGAVYIHGGVDAGDEDDDETREGRIRLFHDNPNVMALVANPAAASEGISLHHVCHHAIYLDRTFNAAHYLQSEDRIHRLGLPFNQETIVEIVSCAGSIDETVDERLRQKINAMADALDDASLRVESVPFDPMWEDDYEDSVLGIGEADVLAILRGFESQGEFQ